MSNFSTNVVYSKGFSEGVSTGRMNIIRELYGNFIKCNPNSVTKDFFNEFKYLTFTTKEIKDIENLFAVKNNNSKDTKVDSSNDKDDLLEGLLDDIISKFKYTINFIKYRDVEHNISFYHTHIVNLIMAFCDYIRYSLVKDLENEDCINLYNELPIEELDMLQYTKDNKLNILEKEYVNTMLNYCIDLNCYGVVEENSSINYGCMMYLRDLAINILDTL